MTEAAQIDRARQVVARALNTATDSVADDASIANLPQWDSLGHMSIVLELERVLGRTLKGEEIGSLMSVADIVAIMRNGS